jgi:hypothetical protein
MGAKTVVEDRYIGHPLVIQQAFECQKGEIPFCRGGWKGYLALVVLDLSFIGQVNFICNDLSEDRFQVEEWWQIHMHNLSRGAKIDLNNNE